MNENGGPPWEDIEKELRALKTRVDGLAVDVPKESASIESCKRKIHTADTIGDAKVWRVMALVRSKAWKLAFERPALAWLEMRTSLTQLRLQIELSFRRMFDSRRFRS